MKQQTLLVIPKRDKAFEDNLGKYRLFIASPGQALVGEGFDSTILLLGVYPDKEWFEQIIQTRMNRPVNMVTIHYFHLVADLLNWLKLNR